MTDESGRRHTPVKVTLPDGVRSAVALSYDTDSGCGYAEPLICHGHTPAFLHEYMLRLCDTADQYGVKLHFMQIANGLEDSRVVGYLREILDRGHIVDSHTHTHMLLTTDDVDALDRDLALANQLFEERLGWKPTILRGPGGYSDGLDGLVPNQEVILKNGFQWVSGRYCFPLYARGRQYAVEASMREAPYVYTTGLIEIPVQGFTDRMWFDYSHDDIETDQEAYAVFRREYGDKPVPPGWRCPWTPPSALGDWIAYLLDAADYAYEHRLLWTPTWHPYSHYLHDPDNRALPALLEHLAGKPETFAFYTMRDVTGMLSVPSE